MSKTLVVAMIALLVGCKSSQIASSRIVVGENFPKSEEALTESYITAVNSKDEKGLLALVHPDCLSDLSSLEEEFILDKVADHCKRFIPREHKVKISKFSLRKVPFSSLGVWDIKPTHEIRIDYRKSKRSSVTVSLYIKPTKDGWAIVIPLLKKEYMKMYKKKKNVPTK